MNKPILIGIEGPEYSGKSTVIKELNKLIPNSEIVRLPGGTPLGEALRPIVKENPCKGISQLGIALAGFWELYQALENNKKYQNKTILLDRHLESIFVYQGCMDGLIFDDYTKDIFYQVFNFLMNHIIKYYDVHRVYLRPSVDTILKRRANSFKSSTRDTSDKDKYDNLSKVEFEKMIAYYDLADIAFSDKNLNVNCNKKLFKRLIIDIDNLKNNTPKGIANYILSSFKLNLKYGT